MNQCGRMALTKGFRLHPIVWLIFPFSTACSLSLSLSLVFNSFKSTFEGSISLLLLSLLFFLALCFSVSLLFFFFFLALLPK